MAAQTFEGGCHCGAVKFTVNADLDEAIACNCSHCAAKGFILTFAAAESFTLHKGEDALTKYLFNKHAIDHLFCARCGVQSFARGRKPDGEPMVAVNIRCLAGVDIAALTPQRVDGRSF